MSAASPPSSDLVSLDVTVRIIQGRDLVAMDRNLRGKRTSSDPYVKVLFGGEHRGKTPVIKKTLNPRWDASDATFTFNFGSHDANRIAQAEEDDRRVMVELRIEDEDKVGHDDDMGTVFVPLRPPFDGSRVKWYEVQRGRYGTKHYCKRATGELQVEVTMKSVKKAQKARWGFGMSVHPTKAENVEERREDLEENPRNIQTKGLVSSDAMGRAGARSEAKSQNFESIYDCCSCWKFP